MLIIHVPSSFKIGDTIDVTINSEPAQVHWRDKGHLVILPDDERIILDQGTTLQMPELRSFVCGDAQVVATIYPKSR